MGGKI